MSQPLAAISTRALVPFASSSAISGIFTSLFQILFIFPSWYLFVINLEPAFSFRCNLPSNLRSNSEERDSESKYQYKILTHVDALFQEAYARAAVGSMSKGHNPRQKPRFPTQANPSSFAITKETPLSSFSSAYLCA